MLDDPNVLKQHDVLDDLKLAADECEQMDFPIEVQNKVGEVPKIDNVIVAGMGGSGLASCLAETWLEDTLSIPFNIKRAYDLPKYVGENTLIIACSYSGNTEETVSCAEQAIEKNAQLAVIASGGKLLEMAQQQNKPFVELPGGYQPRMALIYQLRAIIGLLADFGVVSIEKNNEIAGLKDWLTAEVAKWRSDVPAEQNYAKQIASMIVGKTAAFYSGDISAPVTYKFKICCNETAKNVSFWNQFPEFNHNEMMGWTSHPIEKPFAIFNVVSSFENPQILKRFEVTNRLLSGKRPQVHDIKLQGESILAQLLWGSLLADFANIYLASLNQINPMDVDLVEELKKEL